MVKLVLTFFGLALILTACGDSSTPAPVAAVPAATPTPPAATAAPTEKPTVTVKPTATVKPTVTSKPTATAKPTVTAAPPTATPAPTVTLSPEEQTRQTLQAIYQGKLIKSTTGDVQPFGKTLTVDYTASENLTEKLLIQGINLDFKERSPQIFIKFPNIEYLETRAFTSFKDVKGNLTDQVAIKIGITRKNSATVNWPQINLKNMAKIVDTYYIHPSLQKSWDEIQNN